MAEIDPYAFTNAFNQQVQMGQQRRAYQNQLAQQDVDNQRNRLRDMYMGEQQQWEREDRAAAKQAGASNRRSEAAKTVGGIASRALSLADPAQMRGFLQQAIPAYAEDFSIIAGKPANAQEMLSVPDDQLARVMQQLSAFGEPEAGQGGVHSAYQDSKTGNLVYLTRDGRVVPTQQGIQRYAPTLAQTGEGQQVFDPNTRDMGQVVTPFGQQVSNAATMAGAEAGAAAAAKQGVEAAGALPKVEAQADDIIRTVTQLKDSPGLPYILGWYSKAPIVPDTPQAAADALAQQIEGQTFLQAFESLKGGGQITQIEGQQAKAAIARLSRAQGEEDYKKALDELIAIAKRGKERARQKVGGQQSGNEIDFGSLQ